MSAAVAITQNSMLFKGRFQKAGANQVTATIYVDPHADIPLSKGFTWMVNVISPLVTPDLSKKLFVRGKIEYILLTLDQG